MDSEISDWLSKLSIQLGDSESDNGNNEESAVVTSESGNDNEESVVITVRDPSILNIKTCLLGSKENCPNIVIGNEVVSFRDVPKTSREFEELQKPFATDQLLVTSVKAIINPYIKKSFELKRYFHYHNLEPLLLFHGTKEKYVSSICTFNFNWRYTGIENGFKFGRGVNFSDKPIYAAKFCDTGNKGVIIIADVLVNRISTGLQNLELPLDGIDTTIGYGTRVIVKYDDNEFCPKYVVYFQKC